MSYGLSVNLRWVFSLLYFSVANGEPPIGIPWETFQKYAKKSPSIMKGGDGMKQVKMNLSEELKTYFKSQEDCKKKQYLRKACKILFILGGGIGCFMLGSKYCGSCISRGLAKIYSNYPDVETAMFESLKDYCVKNNI